MFVLYICTYPIAIHVHVRTCITMPAYSDDLQLFASSYHVCVQCTMYVYIYMYTCQEFKYP